MIEQGIIDALHQAESVTAMTGAGISAESGIDTFRDANDSLWANYRPQDLATPEAFERDPKTVWDWYAWRRQQVADAEPNPGHCSLVSFEQHFERFTLITQNVDRLHQRAGSRNVVELHGNIIDSVCHRTGQLLDQATIATSPERPPRSPHHPQGLARPAVVWFGEALPATAFEQAQAATTCDIFFSIGTSSVVQPAASLAMRAQQAGATVIEINPTATPLTEHADYVLKAPAGVALPAIVAALAASRDSGSTN